LKIVIAEKISAAGEKLLRSVSAFEVVGPDEYSKSPSHHLRDAAALIVRSAVHADCKLLEQAPNLRVIGRAGVGVDNVDVEFATARGIVVMNTPGANAVAVAEHTLALMLALARHIARADESLRAGKWEKKSLQGTELQGKVLGIVGLGRVGTELARRARGLNMQVVAFDPYVSQRVVEDLNIRAAALDEVLATCDYLSLHVGLTQQTQNMINATSLARMKAGVRIVNCARGELIDEAALLAALESGHVAGAALDVFAKEPPGNSALLRHARVISTPHIAGSTLEAQEAVGVQIAQQVATYLRESVAQNAVNVPSLTDAEYRQVLPYMRLAEKLAALLAQLTDGNLNEITLSYSGALARWNTALLRGSTIIGVLRGQTQDVVNLVNAEAQAKQRGIHIAETCATDTSAEMNLLALTLRTQASAVFGSGAVVHGNSPRIIELNGAEVEAPLEGSLLIMRNRDVPGVIGRVGSALAAHGVNIARFALGRESALGGPGTTNALGVIQTDVPVAPQVLETLRALPEILSLRPVSL
jgi:D-3-phosphoglycerate dehydrogenase